jgi:hypothetical protein
MLLTAFAIGALIVACGGGNGGGSGDTTGGGTTTPPAQPTGPTLTIFAGSLTDTGNVDGSGMAARFAQPVAIASDQGGNLYIADRFNDSIRKITQTGLVTTIAGVAGKSAFVSGSLPGGLVAPSGPAMP